MKVNVFKFGSWLFLVAAAIFYSESVEKATYWMLVALFCQIEYRQSG